MGEKVIKENESCALLSNTLIDSKGLSMEMNFFL